MKLIYPILLIFAILFLGPNSQAQKKYFIEYSKNTDSFLYYQETVQKGQPVRKAISFVKPQAADQVQLIVKDYNGFIMNPKVNFERNSM